MRRDASHSRMRDAQALGPEARARAGDHATLKLWLRMLACTTQIEDEVRRRLRAKYGVSLARFDYLAQLYRHGGLKMRELSRFLMVTGGNVTGLTDELEREGLVQRASSQTDRRAWIVTLTPQGRKAFEAMAKQHEEWIVELFDGVAPTVVQKLYAHLGELRVHLVQSKEGAVE
ncbi:MAG: MarR family transcriptional regulator [Burkholderiales bacterium]|nr:MarR family transcriptional regulator [Burkholderiales bacterium]